jgi:hypothetical protein
MGHLHRDRCAAWCAAFFVVVVGACGDDRRPEEGSDGGDDADAAPSDLLEGVDVEVVGEVPTGLRAASIAALDPNRLALARVIDTGEAFCPDCVDLEPEDCPDACERALVSVAVLDVSSGELGDETLVEQSFPLSFDHSVDQVEVVRLDDERVGVAWLECDNQNCGGLFAARSCSARYSTVEIDTGTVSPVTTLYQDRFADLTLVAHPELGQLLAVTGKPHGAYLVGVRAAVFSLDGSEVLADWTTIGGQQALAPAAAATADGFAIAVADAAPAALSPDEACQVSCDCLGFQTPDPEDGGLYVHRISLDGAPEVDPLAVGLDDQGFYRAREVLAVLRAGDSLAVATTQSIDREAEIFVMDDGGWTRRHASAAPIPMWLGIMGDATWTAWLGSQPEDGGPATVSRLVAGASMEGEQSRTALTEPVDSNVFEAAPVIGEDGVDTTFLLRGIFGRSEEQASWDHFEVVRVQTNDSAELAP